MVVSSCKAVHVMCPAQDDAAPGSRSGPTRVLAGELRSGETAGFRTLYERIAPSLRAWAELRAKSGLALDPDDVLQEVWLRAFEAVSRFDADRGSFRAWIFGIAKNVALEAVRRGASTEVSPPAHPLSGSVALDSWPEIATSIRSRLARDESARLLMEHIERFDPDDRTILVQCGMEGLPCTVVATRLGINVETATKRWQRLRVRLADHAFAELLEL
jgi:RNA polymerase sigma factor (sigma-70 family)